MAQVFNDNDHDIVTTHTIQCLDLSVSHPPTLFPLTLLSTAQTLCDSSHDIMMMCTQQDGKALQRYAGTANTLTLLACRHCRLADAATNLVMADYDPNHDSLMTPPPTH